MQHPNYRHLYYFWVIAHEKSVTRAAERLHLTPQTLPGQLAKLEAYVGEPLFERRGRSLYLSETGQLVLDYADSMFNAGQELLEILDGRRLGRRGRLRIGVSDVVPKLLAYRFLRKAVEAFDETQAATTYSHRLGSTEVSIFARSDHAGKLTRGFPASLDGAPMLLPTAKGALDL